MVDTNTAPREAHALRNSFTVHFILLKSNSITDFSVQHNVLDLQEIALNGRGGTGNQAQQIEIK